jgi:hypothetical protein
MLIRVNPSALAQGDGHEYVLRFALGGLTTVLAGMIAAKCGPVIGGLFLAFPAIFPATATLAEKHESVSQALGFLCSYRRCEGQRQWDRTTSASVVSICSLKRE